MPAKFHGLLFLLIVSVFSSAGVAFGDTWTVFDLVWSGNTASATGTITIDTTAIPNPGRDDTPGTLPTWAKDLTFTVTGGGADDGTFTENEFYLIDWDTDGATLDFSKNLVGQPLPGGGTWGTQQNGSGGDFFFNSSSSIVPSGGGAFSLVGSGGTGNLMNLVSFTPAAVTPIPSSFIAGIALLALFLGIRTARSLIA